MKNEVLTKVSDEIEGVRRDWGAIFLLKPFQSNGLVHVGLTKHEIAKMLLFCCESPGQAVSELGSEIEEIENAQK